MARVCCVGSGYMEGIGHERNTLVLKSLGVKESSWQGPAVCMSSRWHVGSIA